MLNGFAALFQNNNLRNYLAADFISQLGSNLAFLSLHWHILSISNSNAKVGNAVLIGVIAGLVTCIFAGIITDIFCRKKIILYSNILRAISILLTTLFLYYDSDNIFYLYLFFIIGGVGFNIYIPASKAYLQEIVSKKQYSNSSGFLEFNVQSSLLISSILSGFLYNKFGIYFILGINILSFILSNLLILPIKYVREFKPKDYEGFVDKISLGIRYFTKRPYLLIFIVILILPQIASIGQNIVLPGYVLHHLGEDSLTYGFMSMIYGIGASIISMIFIIRGDNFFKKSLLEISFLISIISLVIMTLSKSVLFSYMAIFMFGFGNAAIKIYLIAYMMKVIEKEYMGRSIAIKNIVITILQIFTSHNIGLIMDLYGDISGYIFLEVIMLFSFGLYIFWGRKWQSILDMPNKAP